MKILGCFKVVPDLDLVAEEDWELEGQLHVDTSYVKPIWNCFDESALEMMLKLSDLSGSFNIVFELSALTIGKEKDESFLKTLMLWGMPMQCVLCRKSRKILPLKVLRERLRDISKNTPCRMWLLWVDKVQ